jgi:hypothetical protein
VQQHQASPSDLLHLQFVHAIFTTSPSVIELLQCKAIDHFFKNEVSILGIKPCEKEGQNVSVSFLTKIM